MSESYIIQLAAKVVQGIITLGMVYNRHGADIAEQVYKETLLWRWREPKERWVRRVR